MLISRGVNNPQFPTCQKKGATEKPWQLLTAWGPRVIPTGVSWSPCPVPHGWLILPHGVKAGLCFSTLFQDNLSGKKNILVMILSWSPSFRGPKTLKSAWPSTLAAGMEILPSFCGALMCQDPKAGPDRIFSQCCWKHKFCQMFLNQYCISYRRPVSLWEGGLSGSHLCATDLMTSPNQPPI